MFSDKGGVGKTWFGRAFVEYLREELGIVVSLYDADVGAAGMLTYLGSRDENGKILDEQDATTGVFDYDITDDRERYTFLDSMDNDTPVTFHDTPANTLVALSRIADNGEKEGREVKKLATMGEVLVSRAEAGLNRPFFMHIINPEDNTTRSVRKALDSFPGPTVKHVVFINKKEARDNDDLPFWHGEYEGQGKDRKLVSGYKTRLMLEEMGGYQAWVPALPPRVAAKVNRWKIRFSDMATHPKLSVTDRAQANAWWRETKTVMAGVWKYLND